MSFRCFDWCPFSLNLRNQRWSIFFLSSRFFITSFPRWSAITFQKWLMMSEPIFLIGLLNIGCLLMIIYWGKAWKLRLVCDEYVCKRLTHRGYVDAPDRAPSKRRQFDQLMIWLRLHLHRLLSSLPIKSDEWALRFLDDMKWPLWQSYGLHLCQIWGILRLKHSIEETMWTHCNML